LAKLREPFGGGGGVGCREQGGIRASRQLRGPAPRVLRVPCELVQRAAVQQRLQIGGLLPGLVGRRRGFRALYQPLLQAGSRGLGGPGGQPARRSSPGHQGRRGLPFLPVCTGPVLLLLACLKLGGQVRSPAGLPRLPGTAIARLPVLGDRNCQVLRRRRRRKLTTGRQGTQQFRGGYPDLTSQIGGAALPVSQVGPVTSCSCPIGHRLADDARVRV
jgi:hypothetical protein